MKIMLRIFCFLLLILSTVTVRSQSHTILQNFSISQVDNEVYLSWVISQGETCNGTKILRSTDSLNFSQIGEIAGICGSPDFAQPFDFVDENPVKNKINFYKLELGNTGFSEVLAIEVINFPGNRALVLPNPSTETATIKYKNADKLLHTLRLYSITGAQILRLEGRENTFTLDTSRLESGTYIFTISEGDNVSNAGGKLVVAH